MFGLTNPYVLLVIAGLLVGSYVKGCTDEKGRFDDYKTAVKAVGEAQEKRTLAIIATDKSLKEKADAENVRTHADLATATRKLRERPGGGQLPPAPTGSSRPQLACYDRPELERAYRDLVAALRGGADEGSACAVDLGTARAWAQGR